MAWCVVSAATLRDGNLARFRGRSRGGAFPDTAGSCRKHPLASTPCFVPQRLVSVLSIRIHLVRVIVPFACLFVPDFPVQAVVRHEVELQDQPVAVLEGSAPLTKVFRRTVERRLREWKSA